MMIICYSDEHTIYYDETDNYLASLSDCIGITGELTNVEIKEVLRNRDVVEYHFITCR